MPHPQYPNPAATWADARQNAPALLVITGDVGAGKTTWCRAFVAAAQADGARVAGLLSPGVFSGDHKLAIDLTDLATGQTRRLADRRPRPDPQSPTRNWAFHPTAVAWGDSILATLTAPDQPRPDLLLIDELGPLELRHGGGWTHALPLLARQDAPVACVVVRPGLLTEFLSHFPTAQVIRIRR